MLPPTMQRGRSPLFANFPQCGQDGWGDDRRSDGLQRTCAAGNDADCGQHLGAVNAAKQGFIDDVTDYQNLRNKLVSYLDILSAKWEETLPKKHPTI